MNKKRKFRVAMIHYKTGMSEGGAENTIKAVSSELMKSGHEVYIITNYGDASIPRDLNVIRVPYVRIPFIKKLDYLSSMITFSLFAFFAALLKRCNIIHVHFYVDGFFPVLLSKVFGIKTVYTAHGILLEELKVATMADAIAAFCRYLKNYYATLGVKCRDAFVGVDEKLMKPNKMQGYALRKELGIGKGDFVVTVVARPAALKAPEVLYDIVKAADEKIHFILVGIGKWQKFHEMKRKNLHLFGIVPHDELPKFYQAADVSLHMETVPGICITMLESVACGTPIISATPGDGNNEAVSPEVGFKMPINANKISSLINRLPKIKPELNSMCRNGYRFLEKRGYLWRITAKSYERIYASI